MEINMEQKLLKLLLKHDFFKKLQGRLTSDMWSDSLSLIYKTIEEAHQRYEADLSIGEVRALHFENNTFTRASKQLVNGVLDGIEMEDEPNEEIATDLLSTLYSKHKAFKIASEATKLMQSGDADFSVIERLLDTSTDIQIDEEYEVVSSDIGELLEQSSPENRFKIRLPTAQEYITGIGRGHFGIIFARPEVGKSSLVADMVIGFLEQGLKVSYFINEEPGYKIMLNHVRCVTEKSDTTLRADMEAGLSQYPEWDRIKDNFKLHDVVGMTIADLHRYAEVVQPDVIIADQLDKFSVSGVYQAGHERLKELYIQGREIAKRNNLAMIGVSQASADAEGRRYLSYDMLDGSKTGKAGEGDLIIGVGKNAGVDEDNIRYLTVSKNKISGWHGNITCMFDPIINKWSA